MRIGIHFSGAADDRHRGEAIVRERNNPVKHLWRAHIVLCIGDGLGTIPMMRQTGTFKNCVWRWQERFAEEQMDWLLLNKTAPLRPLN